MKRYVVMKKRRIRAVVRADGFTVSGSSLSFYRWKNQADAPTEPDRISLLCFGFGEWTKVSTDDEWLDDVNRESALMGRRVETMDKIDNFENDTPQPVDEDSGEISSMSEFIKKSRREGAERIADIEDAIGEE